MPLRVFAALLLTATFIGCERPNTQPPSSISWGVRGDARVIDGDSLVVDGTDIRLEGIDACEFDQFAIRDDGEKWACGEAATEYLRRLVEGQDIRCVWSERGHYGRPLAVCDIYGTGIKLDERMVEAGMAVIYQGARVKVYDRLEPHLAIAKSKRLGLWATEFQTPKEHRQSIGK